MADSGDKKSELAHGVAGVFILYLFVDIYSGFIQDSHYFNARLPARARTRLT